MCQRIARFATGFLAILILSAGHLHDTQVPAPIVAQHELGVLPQVDSIVPSVDYGNLPTELVVMADWATDLFDRAALELPPLVFGFHTDDDSAACSGRNGSHIRASGLSIINICTSVVSFSTQIMVLHEMAHAWADHALQQDRKAAFQALRGWILWRDYDAAPWHENGTEQAAEIIVWGLVDRPLAMVRIENNSCAELDAGYRTLTGHPPLHGFHDHCDA